MNRDTHFPTSLLRDTLEYAEAKALLVQQVELNQYRQELKFTMRVLRRLSPEAVRLAVQDAREQNNDGIRHRRVKAGAAGAVMLLDGGDK